MFLQMREIYVVSSFWLWQFTLEIILLQGHTFSSLLVNVYSIPAGPYGKCTHFKETATVCWRGCAILSLHQSEIQSVISSPAPATVLPLHSCEGEPHGFKLYLPNDSLVSTSHGPLGICIHLLRSVHLACLQNSHHFWLFVHFLKCSK